MKPFAPILVALAVAHSFPAAAQQVQTFGRTGVVHLLSDIKLTSKQRNHFAQFKKKRGYFSYFYIATDENHSFSSSLFHNLEHAREAGDVGCKFFSKSQKATCIPYAVSLPKGMSPNTKRAEGLGPEAYKVFSNKYVKNGKRHKGWAAFAASETFNFGWVAGKETKAKAADTAMQYCIGSVSKTLVGVPDGFRQWSEKRGFNRCKIVHTLQYK